MVDVTYRDSGPWGSGKGANLLPSEVDANFWAIAQALVDLEANPAVPVGIESITMSGSSMTIHLTDGSTMGPFVIPVLTFTWRGEFQVFTSYAELDVFTVFDQGIYLVVAAHTSDAQFLPDITVGSPPVAALQQLFGSTDARLVNLTDVLISEPLLDNQLLLSGSGLWNNWSPGTMTFQDAFAVNITGGVITGMPSPVDPSDVATKAYVDSLPGGATTPDSTIMSNITGGTVGPAIPNTLTDILDHIVGSTRGVLLYRSGTDWQQLLPGNAGEYLMTGGPGADPSWGTGAAGIHSIYLGIGLTGTQNPIEDGGTISISIQGPNSVMANLDDGGAVPVGVSVSALLDKTISNARGTLLARAASGWTALGPGTSGQYLKTQGSGADAMWDNPAGSGTVTSISVGTGLSMGGSPATPITGSGTVSLAQIANLRLLGNITGSPEGYPTAITLPQMIDAAIGSTQGMILYRSAAGWVALSPGTVGYVLTSGGAGANPSWAVASSTGSPIGSGQLLANATGGAALAVGTTLTNLLDQVIGSTRGSLIQRGGSGWAVLSPGTNGQVLTTHGAGANATWATPGGGGTVIGPSAGSPPGGSVDDNIVTWDGTGGDVIQDSGVSIASLRPSGTANTPLFNDGSGGFTNGTRSGNTTKVATVTGSPPVTTHLAVWDASGNLIDGGAVPSGGGSGDVVGPGSATDDHVATFDGTTGKLLQDGGVAITDLLVNGGALGTPASGSAINLTNIPVNNATGVLGTTHGGAGATNGILKANGAGTVSAAAAGTDYAAAPTGSANTPLFNNGSGGFTNGTRTGNSTLVATASGSVSSGHIATWDGNGNLIDGGAIPGGSSGTAAVAQIDTYTSGTNSWSKPSGAKVVTVILYGGGGGGGAGVGAAAGNTRAPGTGGGGGACVIRTFNASDLGSGSPASETVTIGAGGTGGTTSGAVGQAGGNTTFGAHLTAFGGGRGNGNVVGAMTGGGGGGSGSVGSNGATSAVSGGLPTTTGTVVGVSGGGGGGAGTGGMSAEWGGGGGGGCSAGEVGSAGGPSLYGGGGGGGGGGITSGNSPQNSADGGGVQSMSATAAAGGGGANGGNNTGNPGSPGIDGNTTRGGTGGGGGSCNTAGTGGKGGNGGACGGGGGGGGGGTATQGNGGDGGAGRAYVITYF